MNRFLFGFVTFVLGIFAHIFFTTFFSFYGVGPHVLLLLTISIGFIRGPMMGETLGFFWGFFADSTGVNMFGLQMFLLPLAGYLSGQLRRRVASERAPAQLVIGLVGTLVYAVGTYALLDFFEGAGSRALFKHMLLGGFLNTLLVSAVFWVTEQWIYLWKLNIEHI